MSENSKVNVDLRVDEKTAVATLLQGQAAIPKPLYRLGTKVNGTITVPGDHLEKPPKWLTKKEGEDSPLQFSFVEINREKGTIEFVEDEGYPWESNYKGALKFDERFLRFKINTGETFTPLDLGNFFKMNRSFFSSVSEASKLVSKLINFEADVDSKIQEADDGRANKTSVRTQVVTSNVPPSFKLNIPIFKGCPNQLIEVEIAIDARSLNCSLISPEANDYIETIKDEVIDKEKERISEAHPLLRIFEV